VGDDRWAMIGFPPDQTPTGVPEELIPPRRKSVIGRVIFLLITGICLYIFLPKIQEVFEAWSRLGDVHPLWMLPAIVCAVASFGCMWGVQALALGSRDWFSIINTQLAGNAFNRITPGGGATGTALQANMLTSAGIDGACAATAIAIQSVLSTAALVALPLFTVPFIIAGTAIPSGLLSTLWIGIAAFVVMGAIGTSVFVFDWPLQWLGRSIAVGRRWMKRTTPGDATIGERLVETRDSILREIGPHWRLAVGLSIMRWFFEFGVIIATLYGLSEHPNPALTLLAFTTASMLGLLPFTPGGLGFVEAGLTGTLALAGVSGGSALVTTLVYRLLTFWLPIPIGAVAAFVFRRRYPRRNNHHPSHEPPLGVEPQSGTA
jgi:putative heme transporter